MRLHNTFDTRNRAELPKHCNCKPFQHQSTSSYTGWVLCFSHWLDVWTSHESSKFPKWTHRIAEINKNFTIGVSGGPKCWCTVLKRGCKNIYWLCRDVSYSPFGVHWALGWTWCYGKAGYGWRLINFCLIYLILEPYFPSFFLSLSRRKSVTWITAVSCVNSFAQKLRGQNHLKSWGPVLSFSSQTLHGSGKVAVNQYPHQEIRNDIWRQYKAGGNFLRK